MCFLFASHLIRLPFCKLVTVPVLMVCIYVLGLVDLSVLKRNLSANHHCLLTLKNIESKLYFRDSKLFKMLSKFVDFPHDNWTERQTGKLRFSFQKFLLSKCIALTLFSRFVVFVSTQLFAIHLFRAARSDFPSLCVFFSKVFPLFDESDLIARLAC